MSGNRIEETLKFLQFQSLAKVEQIGRAEQ